MLSQQDLQQIAQKGITEEQINTQLGEFKTGFPFLKLKAAASIEDGIVAASDKDKQGFIDAWDAYKKAGHKIVKFVPASGAASRMFKDMFAFLDADYDVPTTPFEKQYFDNIEKFAFYDALDAVCRKNEGKSIKYLIQEGQYKKVVANMAKALKIFGIDKPNIALLSMVDKPSFHIRESVEAQTIVKEHKENPIADCNLVGPIAYDLIVSEEAARLKDYDCEYCGNFDGIVVPNLMTGNLMVKVLERNAGALGCGMLMGAKVPIAITSRSDSMEQAFLSLAACAAMKHDKVFE